MGTVGAATSCLHQIPVIPVVSARGIVAALAAPPPTGKGRPDNGSSPLAVGFTVAAGALAVRGISGGMFNPAVGLGGATGGLFARSAMWVHPRPAAAGIKAGLAFRAQPRRQVTRDQSRKESSI
jgi:glycerol uptake facilitator-like aquaporin